MDKKVFIGVGHGGSDPGAVANGFLEKDLNLDIAWACFDELDRHGVNVVMSRTSDEDDTLEEEVRECNAYLGADEECLAVDIHNNAGGGNGIETWYHFGGGKSKELAEAILEEAVKIGQNSRGAKTRKGSDGRDYYYFIRETVAPAVIVECAFVDNAEDVEIIDTAEEREKMGVAIAKAILKVLGVPYKKPINFEEIEEPVAEQTQTEQIEEEAVDYTTDTNDENPVSNGSKLMNLLIRFLDWLLSFVEGKK